MEEALCFGVAKASLKEALRFKPYAKEEKISVLTGLICCVRC